MQDFYKTYILIIEAEKNIFPNMLESFLTWETYRDGKDPILTELHRMEVDKLEKRRIVKMGVHIPGLYQITLGCPSYHHKNGHGCGIHTFLQASFSANTFFKQTF